MKIKKLIPIILIAIITIISIIYNTFPRLQLNGKKNITLSYRDKYQEQGVIIKNANSNNMSKIKIKNNIDDQKIGNYYVDYSLKVAGKTLKVRRNVKIVDNIEPVIKLEGNQIIEMSINTEYKEPGYTAFDEYDGNLTDKVETVGEVNTEKYGEYIITYRVSDNSSNKVEVNRIVKIVDEVNPTIECDMNYSAFEKGTQNIVGCNANDNFDGDITEKIIVNGQYDINMPGIYKVKYIATDDAGNQTSLDHNVIIYESEEKEEAHLVFNDKNKTIIDEILKVLNNNDIKATFFITLDDIKNNPDYIKKIIESKNDIGIYGYYNNAQYDYNTFEKYILETNQAIYKETGKKAATYWFNEPEKYIKESLLQQLKKYLQENEITIINPNTTILNNQNLSEEQIVNNIIKQINSKKNIIIIEPQLNKENIINLEIIIKLLKEFGYTFPNNN